MWTDDHGPDRLYDKFKVTKVSTGEPLSDDEFFFVLRPEIDMAAYCALLTYAVAVARRSPNLAREIREHLSEISQREIARAEEHRE